MIDMYSVATRLQMMHLPETMWVKSDSLKVEKKKAKTSKGQEAHEAQLWSLLQKAIDINKINSEKRARKKARKEKQDGQSEDSMSDLIPVQRNNLKGRKNSLESVHEENPKVETEFSSSDGEGEEDQLWKMP